MSTETGGAAFPQVDLKDHYGMLVPDRQAGMTLRDYFAAVSLKTYQKDTDEQLYENAIHAYKQADAMLKARGQ